MRIAICSFFLIPFLGICQEATEMRTIKGGTFVPLYGSSSEEGVAVNDFQLDVYPVTRAQYVQFVKEHPKWQRSKVLRLFADGNYLTGWRNDTTANENISVQAPVVNVPWFAAKAYCQCQGKRLPTLDEWEYAAMASETMPNAQQDSVFNHRIIGGYETPNTYKKEVGNSYRNYWGIHDMHGVVWEWTSDFNAVLISGESRQDVDTERELFCGSASINASDLMDYAAFMRYAFRGSVKANYCIQTLGFRCAKDVEK